MQPKFTNVTVWGEGWSMLGAVMRRREEVQGCGV